MNNYSSYAPFQRFLLLLLFVFLSIFSGCGDESVISSQPDIKTGLEVELLTQDISTLGGALTLRIPNDSLNGLTLSIPKNSYSSSRTFHITSAVISSHDFGALFHPISPLIRISNGGGYSDSVMTLTIPVHVPNGHFAMAFAYDATTGELEGLPLLESTSERVSIVTRHFMHSALSNEGKDILTPGEDVSYTNIVVSSIDTNELMKEHFTKFKPGVDDWQFVNYGSYAAPKGHCAGQSTGMLWYYSQKKNKGSPQLFGRFDNDGMRKTPNVWQDDVQGYKFCSMMQNDWDNSLSTLLFRSWQGKDDIRALRAFSYALRLTNQPQYVDIWTSNWKEGHALVVYGISRGTLYVADPNYPGITDRVIHFDEFNRIYMPYFTGLKTGDPGIQFTIIQYAAKTALSNWTTASERWKSIADGTIGNGSFPNFTIVALNDKSEFVPLSDGFQVEQGGRLTLNVRGEGFTPDFEVFNDHEDQLKKDGSSVFLPSGKNLIGIYVKEIKDKKVNWVGFKWFTVNVPGETMPGPASGALKLNLWIDGVKAEVDTATFRVTGSSQIYYFLDINATINNQGKPYKTYARIAVGLWRGGTYSGGLSPLTNWSSYASGSDIYYAPDDKDLGHIAINAWSYKKLEGTFNAKGYSEDKKLSTTIDGDFHFLE